MHLAQMVWIKDYRHSAASHKDPTSSKTWKYYKGKFYFLSFWLSFCTFFTLTCLFFSLRGGKKKPWVRLFRKLLAFFFFSKGVIDSTLYCTQKWVCLTYGRRSLITILLKYWLSVCNQQQFIAWVSVPKCLPLLGLVLLFIIAYFWVYLFKKCWMSFIHRNSKIYSRSLHNWKRYKNQSPFLFTKTKSRELCFSVIF